MKRSPFQFVGAMAIVGSVVAVVIIRSNASHDADAAVVNDSRIAVRTMSLERQSHIVRESFYGFFEPSVQLDVAFEVGGRLLTVGPLDADALKGVWVEAGDELASLESERFTANLAAAEAHVERTLADVQASDAAVARMKAVDADASKEFEHVKQMHERQAASAREYEERQLALDVARFHLKEALSRQVSASAAHEIAKSSLTVSEADLKATVLRAPLAGHIAEVHVEVGEMISPHQPVISIVDTRSVKLMIGVNEKKLLLMREGQRVEIEVPALATARKYKAVDHEIASELTGRIVHVPEIADPMTGQFLVEVAVANAHGLLRPGMIGRAVVPVTEHRAFEIPASALMGSQEAPWVFFVEQMQGNERVARRLDLSWTDMSAGQIFVSELPESCAQIVIEGQSRLADGQRVVCVESELDDSRQEFLVSEQGNDRR